MHIHAGLSRPSKFPRQLDYNFYIGLKLPEISEKESTDVYMGEKLVGRWIRNWTIVDVDRSILGEGIPVRQQLTSDCATPCPFFCSEIEPHEVRKA